MAMEAWMSSAISPCFHGLPDSIKLAHSYSVPALARQFAFGRVTVGERQKRENNTKGRPFKDKRREKKKKKMEETNVKIDGGRLLKPLSFFVLLQK